MQSTSRELRKPEEHETTKPNVIHSSDCKPQRWQSAVDRKSVNDS